MPHAHVACVCNAKGCETISTKVAYTLVRTTNFSLSSLSLSFSPFLFFRLFLSLLPLHCKLYALHAACNLAALICKLSCCAKRRAGKQVLGCSFHHLPPRQLLPLPCIWRQPKPLPLPSFSSFVLQFVTNYEKCMIVDVCISVRVCVCVCVKTLCALQNSISILYARCASTFNNLPVLRLK